MCIFANLDGQHQGTSHSCLIENAPTMDKNTILIDIAKIVFKNIDLKYFRNPVPCNFKKMGGGARIS